jgi:beta-lactamase family protein
VKAVALLAALTIASSASAAARPWQPSMSAAVAYASHRHGEIAFAVRTPTRTWGWHATKVFPSASVLKAMLLVAYLDLPSVCARPLGPADRALLAPMIQRSDNAAAGRVLGIVGASRLRGLAHRAGMRRFTPVTDIWGLSRIDAADQARYFLRIDSLLAPRHRAYAMRLLNTVTPSQRWGLARAKPAGWRLYFKGGWGSGTGWVDHQVALLTRGDERVSVAILTHFDGSHAYGEETLRGIAERLLRGLGAAQDVS